MFELSYRCHLYYPRCANKCTLMLILWLIINNSNILSASCMLHTIHVDTIVVKYLSQNENILSIAFFKDS